MAGPGDSTVWWNIRGILRAASVAFVGFTTSGGTFEAPETFDPYEVRDVIVSAVAEDAVIAKRLAIDEALTTSAKRVLDRVAIDSAGFEIEAAVAESLLSTLENASERFGPGGYAATLTLRFDPVLVRGYLAKRGVGVVDQAAPTVLLIPVVMEDGTALGWDAAADWGHAIEAYGVEDGLTPVRVAEGTAADRAARNDRLAEADFITLGEFRVRYRTPAAALARLERSSSGQGMLVTILGTDAAGPVNATVEVPTGTLEGAAAAAAGILSSRWKKAAGRTGANLHAAGTALPVRVLLPGGPADWDVLKRRLAGSGVIDGLAVTEMSETGAEVEVWYAGRLEHLPDRLERSGLDLFEAGGTWLLQAY